MSTSKEESILLSKISTLTKKIQTFLQEIGYSDKQKAIYFSQIIFGNHTQLKDKQPINQFYKQQINAYLSFSIQKHGSVRIALIHLLTKLQMENGQIEEYERQTQQKKVNPKLPQKRQMLLNEQFISKPRRLFDMMFLKQESEDSSKMVKELDHVKSFEKELQQSLFKTKLLKRMIQQRLAQDLDESFDYANGYQNLLSLEGSG